MSCINNDGVQVTCHADEGCYAEFELAEPYKPIRRECRRFVDWGNHRKIVCRRDTTRFTCKCNYHDNCNEEFYGCDCDNQVFNWDKPSKK